MVVLREEVELGRCDLLGGEKEAYVWFCLSSLV